MPPGTSLLCMYPGFLSYMFVTRLVMGKDQQCPLMRKQKGRNRNSMGLT